MKKGGMTYVQFSGTNFCIADSVGAVEAPDRKTERRGEKKQTEITYFKMRVDGNICSYFFHHADDRFNNYIFTKECFKMVYLVWALIALGIVVGIAFGVSLGVRMDLGKMSDGVIYVGRTSQESLRSGKIQYLFCSGRLRPCTYPEAKNRWDIPIQMVFRG